MHPLMVDIRHEPDGGDMTTLMSIAVADQHLTFADSVAARLLAQEDVGRTSSHSSVEGLMAALAAEPAEVLLLDWGLRDGVEHPIQCVQDAHPTIKILATGDGRDPEQIVLALRAGALGWVPKDVPFDELLAGIRTARRGERYLPTSLLTSVLEEMTRAKANGHSQALRQSLTPRELEVLQCMGEGLSRNEIAERLGMSPNTVRTHVQSVLHKLGVHSSLRAVALAREAGLLTRTAPVPQQRSGSSSLGVPRH
jgi:DNA-binding NarL/FixJ family response regulator